MKVKNLCLVSILSTCLFTSTFSQAGSYEDAVKDANSSIDKAKSSNYEWRDSRKILKKADELNKQGKSEEAMKLVAKAKNQGQLAVTQAESQSDVNGPH